MNKELTKTEAQLLGYLVADKFERGSGVKVTGKCQLINEVWAEAQAHRLEGTPRSAKLFAGLSKKLSHSWYGH